VKRYLTTIIAICKITLCPVWQKSCSNNVGNYLCDKIDSNIQ